METNEEQKALSYFLPDNTLEYFNIVASEKTDTEFNITLEEKNNPPLEKRHRSLPVTFKDFKSITITDYPVRNHKTFLTFRRRRWRVGNETIKRDINLKAPGTMLEREFGLFLKTDR